MELSCRWLLLFFFWKMHFVEVRKAKFGWGRVTYVYSGSSVAERPQGRSPDLGFVSDELRKHPRINHLVDIQTNILMVLQNMLKRMKRRCSGQRQYIMPQM